MKTFVGWEKLSLSHMSVGMSVTVGEYDLEIGEETAPGVVIDIDTTYVTVEVLKPLGIGWKAGQTRKFLVENINAGIATLFPVGTEESEAAKQSARLQLERLDGVLDETLAEIRSA